MVSSTVRAFSVLLCALIIDVTIGQCWGPSCDNNDWNYHSGDNKSLWNPGVPSYSYSNVQAQLVSLFVDTVGINIHGPDSGAYGPHEQAIFQNVWNAGIRHLRVQTSPTDYPESRATLMQLGRMGFKMTMLCDASVGGPGALQQIIKEINGNFTSQGKEPVIIAVEGPNEPDNFWKICCERNYPVTYDGYSFPKGPLLFLQDLYNFIKNDSATSWIKVVGIALGGSDEYNQDGTDMSGYVDWGNMHPYPYGGNSQSYPFNYTNIASYYWRSTFPSVNMDEWNYYLLQPMELFPGRPMMATESGYQSVSPSVAAQPLFPKVTYDAQAKYTPRIYAEYFRLGVKRLLLYEACDESIVTSSNYTTVETFGIMDGTATPKPAWYAMKSLMSLITDQNNPLPPYPQSNDDSYRHQLNKNNVVLSYYTNISQVVYPSSNADCVSYGNLCNQYYRTYFIHHLLLQRPSTNDIFFLVWHEFTAQDLNFNPPRIVPSPPAIPVNFTFTSGVGIDVNNLESVLAEANYYTFDSNYNYVSNPLKWVASNAFTINVPDTIAVVQLTMTSTVGPSKAPSDPPSQAPTAVPSQSPTAPSSPLAAAYEGCFIDSNTRDIPFLYSASNTATIEWCQYNCGVRGYQYAGLQDANQCFCGHSFGSQGKAADSDCKMSCTGNAQEMCGAGWRNSVYSTGNVGYEGCFVDSSTRDLSYFAGNTGVTIDSCRQMCSGNRYKYAGMQNGNECWCGNSYGSQGAAAATDCSTPCAGDNSETCGAGWRNSVYASAYSGYNPTVGDTKSGLSGAGSVTPLFGFTIGVVSVVMYVL